MYITLARYSRSFLYKGLQFLIYVRMRGTGNGFAYSKKPTRMQPHEFITSIRMVAIFASLGHSFRRM